MDEPKMKTKEHRDMKEKWDMQAKSSNDYISECLMEREAFPTMGGVELQSIRWIHVRDHKLPEF